MAKTIINSNQLSLFPVDETKKSFDFDGLNKHLETVDYDGAWEFKPEWGEWYNNVTGQTMSVAEYEAKIGGGEISWKF